MEDLRFPDFLGGCLVKFCRFSPELSSQGKRNPGSGLFSILNPSLTSVFKINPFYKFLSFFQNQKIEIPISKFQIPIYFGFPQQKYLENRN